MDRHVVKMSGVALCGAIFGALVSHVPAPSDPTVFWIGNFSAPWALMPFLFGRLQTSVRWAAACGAAADVACVCGFYAAFLTADPIRLGLSPNAGFVEAASTGIVHWAAFVAPWVVLGTATGTAYGFLGCWWGRSRPWFAGLAAVAPLLAEPVLWRMYRGFLPGPAVIWLPELALGAIGLLWVIRVARADPNGLRPKRV